jgi:hypothetical protein
MNFEETKAACREHGFNQEITEETLWNTAYQLGRDRWYWGPRWFVSLTGWFNTQKDRLFKISQP